MLLITISFTYFYPSDKIRHPFWRGGKKRTQTKEGCAMMKFHVILPYGTSQEEQDKLYAGLAFLVTNGNLEFVAMIAEVTFTRKKEEQSSGVVLDVCVRENYEGLGVLKEAVKEVVRVAGFEEVTVYMTTPTGSSTSKSPVGRRRPSLFLPH